MPDTDLRWRQRFNNFQRALQVLELAWTLLQVYLQQQAIQGITGSRDATRLAFQTELIAEVVIDRCVATFAALRERFAALGACRKLRRGQAALIELRGSRTYPTAAVAI